MRRLSGVTVRPSLRLRTRLQSRIRCRSLLPGTIPTRAQRNKCQIVLYAYDLVERKTPSAYIRCTSTASSTTPIVQGQTYGTIVLWTVDSRPELGMSEYIPRQPKLR